MGIFRGRRYFSQQKIWANSAVPPGGGRSFHYWGAAKKKKSQGQAK